MKKDLLDVLKGLCTIENNIRDFFGECDILSQEISDLATIIVESYGKSIDDDIVFEQLMNFGDGDITKKKLIEKYLK